MEHVYPRIRKTFVLASLLTALTVTTQAQNPTTVFNSEECNVVEDFNTDNGGFKSPSIYSNANDLSFYYYSAEGYWLESENQSQKEASIISGVYLNSFSGSVTVGFKYKASKNSDYRIRVISVNCSCVGGLDIIATTAVGTDWTPLPEEEGRVCVRLVDADIQPGQHLRYEITIRSRSPRDIIFDDFSLGEIAAAPLPVTFKGIVARSQNSLVTVQWDVADEIDVKGYQVERSTNGLQFEAIGFVDAHGKPFYSYTDAQAGNGTVFYRVKSVDIDGSFKYSSIVRVSNKRSTTLKLFPVPAQNEVTLQHERIMGNTVITLTTADGRAIKQIRATSGTYLTPVSLAGLQPGLYLLRLEDGQGGRETIKLIKQ
jgi:hypothetical protein